MSCVARTPNGSRGENLGGNSRELEATHPKRRTGSPGCDAQTSRRPYGQTIACDSNPQAQNPEIKRRSAFDGPRKNLCRQTATRRRQRRLHPALDNWRGYSGRSLPKKNTIFARDAGKVERVVRLMVIVVGRVPVLIVPVLIVPVTRMPVTRMLGVRISMFSRQMDVRASGKNRIRAAVRSLGDVRLGIARMRCAARIPT